MNMDDFNDDFLLGLGDLGLGGLVEKIHAMLKGIPQGLGDFKVNEKFIEIMVKDFEASGFDPAVLRRTFDGLSLSRDNQVLSRYVRRKLKNLNMEHLYDTQEQYLDKEGRFDASSYEALTGYLAAAQRLLEEVAQALETLPERLERLVVAPLVQKISELQDQIDNSEDKRTALEVGNQENLGKAIERMSSGETGQAPSVQGDKKLSKKERQALKEQEDEDQEREEKLKRKATQKERLEEYKANSKAMAMKELQGDEALVDRLLEGLPALTDSAMVKDYVERVLVIEAKVDYTTVFNIQMCRVYAANVGYDITVGGLQNALREYFNGKYSEAKK